MLAIDLLRQKIREEMNTLTDHLVDPGVSSYDDYRFIVGQVRGLALAERHLLDIFEEQEIEQ